MHHHISFQLEHFAIQIRYLCVALACNALSFRNCSTSAHEKGVSSAPKQQLIGRTFVRLTSLSALFHLDQRFVTLESGDFDINCCWLILVEVARLPAEQRSSGQRVSSQPCVRKMLTEA